MEDELTKLLIALLLVVLSAGNIVVTPGVVHTTLNGFVTSNLDPDLNSPFNNQYYDPNFIPGFRVGLTNTSVYWHAGNGYADIGYSIGPWSRDEHGIPHLAVGPQCCNFVEVNHTQQFRQVDWGDYYYVRAGFGPPGVNIQNYTADFKSPAAVGLRTDWNWTVQVSLSWKEPALLNQSNEWAAVGIATTQYVSNVPGNLVYSVVDFWMDQNSSKTVSESSSIGVQKSIAAANVVVYHPLQLSVHGNQTLTFNLSSYLSDTLRTLDINPSQPPVISYVYLNVEGYNFAWNASMYSFRVMASSAPASTAPILYLGVGALAILASVVLAYRYVLRPRLPAKAKTGQ